MAHFSRVLAGIVIILIGLFSNIFGTGKVGNPGSSASQSILAPSSLQPGTSDTQAVSSSTSYATPVSASAPGASTRKPAGTQTSVVTNDGRPGIARSAPTSLSGIDYVAVAATGQRDDLPWVPISSLMENIGTSVPSGQPILSYGCYYLYPPSSVLQACCGIDDACTYLPSQDTTGLLVARSSSNLTNSDFAQFTKDASGVYLNAVRIAGADATTFNVFLAPDGTLYAADKNHAYSDGGQLISGVDPDTFTVLAVANAGYNGIEGYEFDKDKKHVYFPNSSTRVPGADPATFSVGTDGLYARDRAHTYCVGYSQSADNYMLVALSGDDPAACSPPITQ